jgi:hypothetical protein
MRNRGAGVAYQGQIALAAQAKRLDARAARSLPCDPVAASVDTIRI